MNLKHVFLSGLVAFGLAACASQSGTKSQTVEAAPQVDPIAAFWEKFDQTLAGSHRSPENKARDVYRHPKETLQFFGLKPGQDVVEITPGQGWYTEILGPTLLGNSSYTVAILSEEAAAKSEYQKNARRGLITKLSVDIGLYRGVRTYDFSGDKLEFTEANTADLVLTFRNIHNFMGQNKAEAYFKGFYDALKPGGVLGVVEHRANPGTSIEDMKKSGYVTVEHVKQLAAQAGFEFVAESEINANPKDTKDHPNGVWTLPPTLGLKDKDREKYLAIGESDRMTLKFIKPLTATTP